ncbi:MAG: hypothetical protein WBG30_10230 [Psychrilyobacter sp.]|uniref:hypothetical protein n=1 Tax=Psychrilyobacter sp. TaxID=2586924 RepID=UPI003C77AEC1
MSSKIAIKGVMKMLDEESISTEDLLSDEFFKKYSSLNSLEAFEDKFNINPGKGVTKEKQTEEIIRRYTEFKNLDEMKNKAIEFYAED